MTKNKPSTLVFLTSTLALVALGQSACLSDQGANDLQGFEDPDWMTDKSKFAEEWEVSGYARWYDYCRDGKAKSPRITHIVTTGQSGAKTQLRAHIAGCTAYNTRNYVGYISGEVNPDPNEPNTWFVSGAVGVEAILADGTYVKVEDLNAVWAIDFTERNTECLQNGGDSIETATRDVTLRAPGPDYETERLLRQLRPSTLDGTRYTSCD